MKREVAYETYGFSVENVRFLKPGGRSRFKRECSALSYAETHDSRKTIDGAVPEKSVFDYPDGKCLPGFIMGDMRNTRRCCNVAGCRAKRGVTD